MAPPGPPPDGRCNYLCVPPKKLRKKKPEICKHESWNVFPIKYLMTPISWQQEGQFWYFRLSLFGKSSRAYFLLCMYWFKGEKKRKKERGEGKKGPKVNNGRKWFRRSDAIVMQSHRGRRVENALRKPPAYRATAFFFKKEMGFDGGACGFFFLSLSLSYINSSLTIITNPLLGLIFF